jgi:hypothetical protein
MALLVGLPRAENRTLGDSRLGHLLSKSMLSRRPPGMFPGAPGGSEYFYFTAESQEVADRIARAAQCYLFLASDQSRAAPAVMPAIASPVRFMDVWIAAWWGLTQASSG